MVETEDICTVELERRAEMPNIEDTKALYYVPDSYEDLSAQIVDDSLKYIVPDSEEEQENVVVRSHAKKLKVTSNRCTPITLVYKRRQGKNVGVAEQSSIQCNSSARKTFCEERCQTITHVYRRRKRNNGGVGEHSSIQSLSSATNTNNEEHCDKEILQNERITRMNIDVNEADRLASSHYETYNGEQDASTPVHLSDLEIVSATDSQEPEEPFPEKALEFVDHFLLENHLSTPGDQKIGGGKGDPIRSPPEFSAKGALTLARRVSLSDKPRNLKIFDWNAEETTGFYSVNGSYKNLYSRSQGQLEENDEGEAVLASTLDVGFDTQMAAEAMEALTHSLPPKTLLQRTHVSQFCPSVENFPDLLNGDKPWSLSAHSEYNNECRFQKQFVRTAKRNKRKPSERLPEVPKNPVNSSRRSLSNNLDLAVPKKRGTGKFLESSSKIQPEGSKSSVFGPSIPYKLDLWCYMKKKRTHRGVPRRCVMPSNSSTLPSCPKKKAGQMDPDRKACRRSWEGDIMVSKENVDLNVVGADSDTSRIRKKLGSSVLLAKEVNRLGCAASLPNLVPKNLRRRKNENVCVLFSQHLESKIFNQQKKIIARLGFSVASCCSDATHFVADRFTRTRNMLEAISVGKPVVSPFWLESCDQANYYVDEERYILRDVKKEKELGFSMPATLASASKNPLLMGQRVFSTPGVKPGLDLIQSLVKSVHGKVVERIAEVEKDDGCIPKDLLILSCKEDYARCVPLVKKGATIYDSELLLSGIIIQKLEFERHRLFFTEHAQNTGSRMRPRRQM